MTVADKTEDQYIKVPSSKYEETKDKDKDLAKGFGVRHRQVIIFFFCLTTSILARNHIGVVVVAMTNPLPDENVTNNIEKSKINNETNIDINPIANNVNIANSFDIHSTKNNSNQSKIDFVNNAEAKNANSNISNGEETEYNKTITSIYKTYNWTKPIHETVMSSFYLGYSIGMLPMGLVCQKWGGKIPLQISLLINGVLSLITPWIALWGDWKAVSATRLLQGLSQAGTYPCLTSLISKWAAPSERAAILSYVYSGVWVGNILAFQIGGFLSDSVGGWPSAFWTVGLMCLASFTLLTVFGAATPMVHGTITKEEMIIIKGNSGEVNVQQTLKKTPYKAILTSVPVWAIFVSQLGSNIAYLFFCAEVASYNYYILGISIKNSGALASLPYVASLVFGIVYGNMSDYLTKNHYISLKTARRLFNSISQIGGAICLIGVSFAHNAVTASLCFFFLMALGAATNSGWMVNMIEISSNYSGTLVSIGNTFSIVASLGTPILMSNIVVDVRNPAQWHAMLYLVAGLCVVTNIIFLVFLSVEDQPWNKQDADGSDGDDA